MGIGLRQTMRESLFRSMRDLAAEDDSVAAAAPSGIDPIALFQDGWDANRSTLAVNGDGTGGAVAVNGEVGRVSDLIAARHMTKTDGIFNVGPLLKTDATRGRNYLEGANAATRRLVTTSGDINLSQPFTMALVFRIRTNTDGWSILCAAGASQYQGMFNTKGGTTVELYSGTALQKSGVSSNAWHVAILEYNGASSGIEIDGSATTGAGGALTIPGNLSMFAGPNNPAGTHADVDIMELWVMPGLLSAGNKAGVRTFLGNHAGLSL